MSNILNLLTASLLAVSPIFSQPKMVERPDNVLMEKVEYLDNNIIATSYLDYVDDHYYFEIFFTDNKLIDVHFIYYSYLSTNINGFDFILNGQGGYTENVENDFTSFNFSDNEVNQFLNNDYLITCNFDSNNDTLDFNVPYWLLDEGNLYFDNYLVYYDVENGDYQEYYSNIENVINYNLKNNNLFNTFLKRYVLKIEGSSIIDNTFAVVGNTIEEYVSVVVDLFSQVLALFIVNGQLTILGILLIFTFGIGVVKFGFEFIKSLLRL